MRKDIPVYKKIAQEGIDTWKLYGKLHRIDGPSFIHPNGYQSWYINGLRHRLDGPAVIGSDGSQKWWIDGFAITDQVVDWIKDNDFPHWTKWTDTQKIMFRLAFSGISLCVK